MTAFDDTSAWYHGSPEELSVLSKGSWVTPFVELAKAFSHKPSTISMADDVEVVRHNGQLPGMLYIVDETVGKDDIAYLKDTAQTHWQTRRDLKLRLLARLPIDDPPQLTEDEKAELQKKAPPGGFGFVGDPDQ